MEKKIKLQFMKAEALEYFKHNLDTYYENYFKKSSNKWIYEKFEDPFEDYIEVDYFELFPVENNKLGTVEFENYKIIYENLKSIPENIAADERLWAGLCNGVFYEYLRKRWGYNKEKLNKLKDKKDEAELVEKLTNELRSRFFFNEDSRKGVYRNSLSKCWWSGYNFYDESKENKFEYLDILGENDVNTIVNILFNIYKYTFNKTILYGILLGVKHFKDSGISISRIELPEVLKEINSNGGCILLDALSEEDIKNMFIEIFNKQRGK